MNPPVSFHTERLLLREFELSDSNAMHDIAANADVARYMDWQPERERETLDYLRQSTADREEDPRTSYRLAAVPKDSGRIVGAGWLHISNTHNREASIGYVVHPNAWGGGFATEIAAGLVRFGFEQLGLHRIYAECDPENVPSLRVLEKIGMTREGHLREHLLIRGEWRDSLIYAILENEQLSSSR